jgi:hypothetical protein
MEQEQNGEFGQVFKFNKNLLVKIFVGVVLVVITVVLVRGYGADRSPEVTQEDVVVENIDLSLVEGDVRLPTGFPSGTPVELMGIYDSLRMSYTEIESDLYTVSYTSERSAFEIYGEWQEYLQNEGYSMEPSKQSLEAGTVFGTKDGNEMSVAINSIEEVVSVQVVYLDRRG